MIGLDLVLKEAFSDCDVVKGLADLRSYDEDLYVHSTNVCTTAIKLAVEYINDFNTMVILAKSALLHDIGKMKIPIEIINPKSELTKSELDLLRLHSLYSAEWVLIHLHDRRIASNVITLHETAESDGFPCGLNSAGFSVESRILHIVDYRDAMQSNNKFGHESFYDASKNLII